MSLPPQDNRGNNRPGRKIWAGRCCALACVNENLSSSVYLFNIASSMASLTPQSSTWNPKLPHRNLCPLMDAKITIAMGGRSKGPSIPPSCWLRANSLKPNQEYSLILFWKNYDKQHFSHVACNILPGTPKIHFDVHLYDLLLLGLENSQSIYLKRKIRSQKPLCRRPSHVPGSRILPAPTSDLELLLPFVSVVSPVPIKSNLSGDRNKA